MLWMCIRIAPPILWFYGDLIITEIKTLVFSETLTVRVQYGDVHVMKTYVRFFKSHDDPQNSPAHDKVSEPVRTLFTQDTQRARREYAQNGRRSFKGSLKLVYHSLLVRYQFVLGSFEIRFSSVCQASMITFVGFLQRIPP